jgi:hypothetical protein
MDYSIFMCWKCKKNTVTTSIYRNSECPVCNTDLHSCLNCKFYDESSHYECKETIDELVKDKERRNFCDYFVEKRYDSNSDNSIKSVDDAKKSARDAFNSLFS